MNQDIASLFAGSDDEGLLLALHRSIQNPCNDAQRTFRETWDAVDIVHGETDGLETLLVLGAPLEDYAVAFSKLGMSAVPPILARVLELIPPGLQKTRDKKALKEHLPSRYDELTELTSEFCAACSAFAPIAARYVREHRGDFCADVGNNAREAEPGGPGG